MFSYLLVKKAGIRKVSNGKLTEVPASKDQERLNFSGLLHTKEKYINTQRKDMRETWVYQQLGDQATVNTQIFAFRDGEDMRNKEHTHGVRFQRTTRKAVQGRAFNSRDSHKNSQSAREI